MEFNLIIQEAIGAMKSEKMVQSESGYIYKRKKSNETKTR